MVRWSRNSAQRLRQNLGDLNNYPSLPIGVFLASTTGIIGPGVINADMPTYGGDFVSDGGQVTARNGTTITLAAGTFVYVFSHPKSTVKTMYPAQLADCNALVGNVDQT